MTVTPAPSPRPGGREGAPEDRSRASGPALGTSLRGGRWLFIVLLVAAIAINVARFGSADREVAAYWHAVHRYDTSMFAELSVTNRHIRLAYGVYRALAELAPGSTVIVPDATSETIAKLYGVGDAASVRIDPAAPDTLPTSFDLGPFIMASGGGGVSGKNRRSTPWGIALDEGGPPDGIRGGPRELIMVSWADPNVRPKFRHRMMLVETSLLPPDVREAVSR